MRRHCGHRSQTANPWRVRDHHQRIPSSRAAWLAKALNASAGQVCSPPRNMRLSRLDVSVTRPVLLIPGGDSAFEHNAIDHSALRHPEPDIDVLPASRRRRSPSYCVRPPMKTRRWRRSVARPVFRMSRSISGKSVWRSDPVGGKAHASAQGREQPAEEDLCRSERQGNAAGRSPSEALRPARWCRLVREDTIRRACATLLIDRSLQSLHVETRRADRASSSKRLPRRACATAIGVCMCCCGERALGLGHLASA